MRIHLPRLSSLLKGLGVCVLLLLALAVWALTDRPLDPETREWLRVPPVPANDAAVFLARLDEAAPDTADEQALRQACAGLGLHCQRFVLEHRQRVLARAPEDPAYWQAYDALLSATTLSADPSRVMSMAGSTYIGAVRWSAIREMAEFGQVRPAFAIRTITAQRRLLAVAPSLIDKMVFNATTGMGFNLLLLTIQATPPQHPAFADLVDAAAPLDVAELSLGAAMQGEVRLMMHELDQSRLSDGQWAWQPPPNRLANARRRRLEPLVALSELPPAAFWQSPGLLPVVPAWWDWMIDPTSALMGHLHAVAAPAYASYVVAMHELELQARIVRTWGRLRAAGAEGNFETLAEPAPPGWRWRQEVASLCLVPESLPAWLEASADEVCLPGGE